MKQTYDNYYREYYKTESGRAAKRRAQTKYRQKLAQLYGTSQPKAIEAHKGRHDGGKSL